MIVPRKGTPTSPAHPAACGRCEQGPCIVTAMLDWAGWSYISHLEKRKQRMRRRGSRTVNANMEDNDVDSIDSDLF